MHKKIRICSQCTAFSSYMNFIYCFQVSVKSVPWGVTVTSIYTHHYYTMWTQWYMKCINSKKGKMGDAWIFNLLVCLSMHGKGFVYESWPVTFSASPSPNTLTAHKEKKYTPGANLWVAKTDSLVSFAVIIPLVLWEILYPVNGGLEEGGGGWGSYIHMYIMQYCVVGSLTHSTPTYNPC